ncbi:uncharacterized protein B0H18DRAFT_674929 [Fomitopsis serialis]|uniref:uncharacterized protein n=1 Tax=Fomitopsis serialis TaxID=139415 RepID=UPI00200891CA|nr:uncharacterized protein B0H18DRAFT_674929 [Neoantrodia serialis]KAH9933033.1 hypothetical protein B0H18DRAFT_674929 [Neoantrodia serialis]
MRRRVSRVQYIHFVFNSHQSEASTGGLTPSLAATRGFTLLGRAERTPSPANRCAIRAGTKEPNERRVPSTWPAPCPVIGPVPLPRYLATEGLHCPGKATLIERPRGYFARRARSKPSAGEHSAWKLGRTSGARRYDRRETCFKVCPGSLPVLTRCDDARSSLTISCMLGWPPCPGTGRRPIGRHPWCLFSERSEEHSPT